jgi:hypothetical protein
LHDVEGLDDSRQLPSLAAVNGERYLIRKEVAMATQQREERERDSDS